MKKCQARSLLPVTARKWCNFSIFGNTCEGRWKNSPGGGEGKDRLTPALLFQWLPRSVLGTECRCSIIEINRNIFPNYIVIVIGSLVNIECEMLGKHEPHVIFPRFFFHFFPFSTGKNRRHFLFRAEEITLQNPRFSKAITCVNCPPDYRHCHFCFCLF